MELRWLDDFITLARVQHFSRAAEERHISQPTFSRRIKLLEETVGATLIDRDTLPLSLTPAGQTFLQTAEEVSRLLRDTCQSCQQIKQQESERLVFATTQNLYLSLYKTWLEPFAGQHAVAMELNLQSTAWAAAEFVTAMQQGKCDLMLCYWHPHIDSLSVLDEEGFAYLKVADDHLIPVSAPDQHGKPRFQLPGNRNTPLPYIAYHPSSFMASLLKQTLRWQNTACLSILNENRHAINISAMIKEGFGLGWVPQRLVAQDLNAGLLIPAGSQDWFIPMEIRLYRSKRHNNQNIQRLWQALAPNPAL
ncbi:MAG: LysR family transcriptional regulator [Thiothrix nivea]|nr:MAG: LysR family transcriptional regulator [Thiothrix nivea]